MLDGRLVLASYGATTEVVLSPACYYSSQCCAVVADLNVTNVREQVKCMLPSCMRVDDVVCKFNTSYAIAVSSHPRSISILLECVKLAAVDQGEAQQIKLLLVLLQRKVIDVSYPLAVLCSSCLECHRCV